MSSLLKKYIGLLEKRGTYGSNYTNQKLKLRMKSHFGETIVFHQPYQKNSPEIVYSSSISVQDVINRSAIQNNIAIGLAMSVRHMTGSNQPVSILNQMGHCSSYDETESVDTGLAKEILAKSQDCGTVIASNISPGAFIQFAADNNDLNGETLDGKGTTHATTLVVDQKKPFGPMPPPKVHAY